MPRGEHPNSRANLNKAYGGKGGFDTETARKAREKSQEAKTIYKSLNANLRDKCTPEVMDALNDRILLMAKHGNLKAYELVRDGLGEKPTEKHELKLNEDMTLDRLREDFPLNEA